MSLNTAAALLPKTPSNTPELRFRYTVTFGKHGPMRFTSHLDLQRCFERLMRRARLPMLFSKGFHPRPKMQFAAPLPLGYTSDGELVDIWLNQHCAPQTLCDKLQQVSPPGLCIQAVSQVALKGNALNTQIQTASYTCHLNGSEAAAIRARVETFLASTSCMRERRGKQYDLRPLVESLTIVSQDGASVVLEMLLANREGQSARAEEVLSALDLDPHQHRIHRTRLNYE